MKHTPVVLGRPRLLSLAISLAFSHGCFAGSAAGEIQLSDVVVSGGTQVTGGLPTNLPANSAGYNAQELYEQVNVINTEDIVKYSPDTMTRKRYIGDRNSIIETRTASVTSSARALVYADGILLSNLLGNSYSYPARWNMVSPEEIQRVDFFFGPHSAEYPGNSIGTTVFMTTRMPDKFEGSAKVQAFSENFSQYGTSKSYNGSNLNAQLGSREGDFSWWLGANHLHSFGHPMSFVAFKSATSNTGGTTVTGVQRDTDTTGAQRLIMGGYSQEETTQDSMKIKLGYDFSPTLKATYTLGSWQNRSFNGIDSYLRDAQGNTITTGKVLYNGATYNLANSFAQNAWSQDHLMQAITLKSTPSETWDWEAIVSQYNIVKDEQHSSLPGGSTSNGKTYYGQLTQNPYGDGWQTFDWRAHWRSGEGLGKNLHEVSFGAHYDQYALNSKTYYNTLSNDGSWQYSNAQSQLTSSSTGKTSTAALYLQDAWRFMPDWRLIAGGRYEQWSATNGSNSKLLNGTLSTAHYADRQENFFSPKLSLEYALNDDWVLRGSLSDAYRMPTVTELFQSLNNGNSVISNNPNLKPEHATTGELTAERGLNNGLLRISVFQENMRDALYSQSTQVNGVTMTAIQNIDRVRTRGITAAYQQKDVGVRGFDLTGSLTYANARTLENAANRSYEGKVFPGVPDWRATVVGSYRPSDKVSYAVGARYSGYQAYAPDNSDINQGIYGANSRFLVVDARVTYKLEKNMSAAIGIDNLTNQAYYAYHPMPQRTVHAELKYTF